MPAWLRTISGKGPKADNGKGAEQFRPTSQATINVSRSPSTVLRLLPNGSSAVSTRNTRHTISSFWKKDARPTDPAIDLPVPAERTVETANHHIMRSILQSRAKTMVSFERVTYDGPNHADPVARAPCGPPPEIPLPAKPRFQDHRSVLFLYAAQPDDCRLELLDSLPEHQRVAVEHLALKVYDVMEKEGLEMCDAFETGWDEDEKSFVGKIPPSTDKNSPIKLKKGGTRKEKNRVISTPALHLPSTPFSKTNRTFTDPTVLPRAHSPTSSKSYYGGNILHFKKCRGPPQGEYPKVVSIPGAEEKIIELNDPDITRKWLKDTVHVMASDQSAFVEELNSENPHRSKFPPLPLTSGGGQYSGANQTLKRGRPVATSAANRNFQRIVDAFIAKEMGIQKYKTILEVALDQRSFAEDAVFQEFMAIMPDHSLLLDEDDQLPGQGVVPDNYSYVEFLRVARHQQRIRDGFSNRKNGSLRSEVSTSSSRSFATLRPQTSTETIVYKPQVLKTDKAEDNLSSTIISNLQVLGASQSMGHLSSPLRSAAPTPTDGQEEDEQKTLTLSRAKTMSSSMKRLLTMSNLHASQLRAEYGGIPSSDIYSDADEITTPVPFSATIAAGDNARRRRRLVNTGKQVEEIDDLSWKATVGSQSVFKKNSRKSIQYLDKKRVVSQRLDEESSKGKDLLTPIKLKARREFDEEMEKRTEEAVGALKSRSPLSLQGQFKIFQISTPLRNTGKVDILGQPETFQFPKPPGKTVKDDDLFEFLVKEVSDDGYSSPLEDCDSTELMGKMGSQNFHYRKTLTTFSKDSEDTESLLAASAADLRSFPVMAGSGAPHLRARRSSRRLGSSPLAKPPILAADIPDSGSIINDGAAEEVFGDATIANEMPIQHHPFRDPPSVPQLSGHAERVIPSSPTNKYSGSIGRARKWMDYTTSPPRQLPAFFIESARDRQDISNNFKWKERVDRKLKTGLCFTGDELPSLFDEESKQCCPSLPSLETRKFLFEEMTGRPVPWRRPSQDQEQMWQSQPSESEEIQLRKLYSNQIDENGIYRTPDIDSGGDIAPPAPVSLRKNAFEINQRVPSSTRSTTDFSQENSLDEFFTNAPEDSLASKPSRFARFGLGSRNIPSRDNMVSPPVPSSPPVRNEKAKLTKKHRLQSFLPSSSTMPKSMVPQTKIVVEDRPANRSPERIPYEEENNENESSVHRLPNSQTAADFQIFAKSAVAYADRKRDSRMN